MVQSSWVHLLTSSVFSEKLYIEKLLCRESATFCFCKKGSSQQTLSQEFSWFVGLQFTKKEVRIRDLPRNFLKFSKHLKKFGWEFFFSNLKTCVGCKHSTPLQLKKNFWKFLEGLFFGTYHCT